MTYHELQYCRFLLQCIKDLYVEREAMSTILDTPGTNGSSVVSDWRSEIAKMSKSPVFCSAVEANFAPQIERLKCAINNEQVLASLLAPPQSEN